MADISKIRVDEIDYDVKDAVARTKLGNVSDTDVQTQLNNKLPINQTSIPKGANLNSYTTPGFYCCKYNSDASSLLNCPTTNAFFLEVGFHSGWSQRLTEYKSTNPRIYVRNTATSGWGQWYEIPSLPVVTADDNGKILKVVNGVWTAVAE